MSVVPTAVLIDGEVGGDVRRPSHDVGHVTHSHPEVTSAQVTHDPSITFEEYLYYAEITRKEEEASNALYLSRRGPSTVQNLVKRTLFKSDNPPPPPTVDADAAAHEKSGDEKVADEKPSNGSTTAIITGVTADEWKQASRALRTAGWGGVFYLITTDILGPFTTPWAFAQMGYGPGVALYTVFGIMSYYSGYLLWKAFLDLDSDKYPVRGYGDLYYRVFGPLSRHLINFSQGLQLLLFVSVLILGTGQAISQISKGPPPDPNDPNAVPSNGLCFVACLVITMSAGFILGQIRTLAKFSWLANIAVYINLLVIFICMGVAANSLPNFTATAGTFGPDFVEGPIRTFAGTPPDGFASGGSGFIGSLNGLNQAVYSFGGCMVFAAFMAEMRHPHDFWKSLLIAEIFIYVVYLFFGIFIYSYQGQFTFIPVMQGLSPYAWQTATNIMGLFTAMIAACLYGNIGLKVLYVELLQEVFNAPPLTASAGKWLWAALIPIYWAVAFIIAAAIPQFSNVSGFIGALFILSFTYTLPALLSLGFNIKKDAMTEQERFDPITKTYNYTDSGFKRFARGFLKRPFFNTWNIIYLLGGLATTGLGMYSSIEGLIAGFEGRTVATSFGCATPV
ncbi:transmembrane amino acid transporter [Lasiosphaeria ovina]|uniref:Transmembrane amino acid transporter n=1 Tax=Lasiosphaeria ovina TaxID=92902 RepID=A0AAE0K451_9PEZI|nr:transmembrane amino acid transporter [Lasiosphaeria ovina]